MDFEIVTPNLEAMYLNDLIQVYDQTETNLH